jgi:uncharacterized membrane protein
MLNRMSEFIKKNYVVILFVLFTLIYFSLSSYRHLSFSSTSLDLGSYTQTFWLYSNFEEPVNTVLDGRVPLGDHFEPLLIPLSMLYKLIPSPFFLFFLQSIAIASIVFPLSYLLNKVVKEKVLVFLFLLSTITSFIVINAVIYDFHPLLIIAGLTAWLLYFMEEEKWKPMFIVLLLVLLLKETVGLLGILLGIYMVIRKKKVGVYVIAISLLQFIVAEKFVIPHFLGDQTYHLRYQELGESFGEIIKTIITNPLKPIEILTRPQFLGYYAITILRFPLAILHPVGWILILSNIAERFLSTEATYWGDSFHYGIMLVPILSFVSIKGIEFLKGSGGKKYIKILLSVLLLVISVNLWQVFKYEGSRYLHLNENVKLNVREYINITKVLKTIPSDVSVSAQDNFIPHLANRKDIYKLVSYEKAKYLVIDSSKSHWPLSEEEYNELLEVLKGDRYREVDKYNSLIIYIKNEKDK